MPPDETMDVDEQIECLVGHEIGRDTERRRQRQRVRPPRLDERARALRRIVEGDRAVLRDYEADRGPLFAPAAFGDGTMVGAANASQVDS